MPNRDNPFKPPTKQKGIPPAGQGPDLLLPSLTKMDDAVSNLSVQIGRLTQLMERNLAGSGHGHGFNLAHTLLFGHMGHHGTTREAGKFWTEFFATGRRVGKDFWIMDGHAKGGPAGRGPAVLDRVSDRARLGFAVSSRVAGDALHAASPAAAATLEKSWKLFEAKAFSGLVRPATRLAFKLQDAGNWVDRQPEGVQNALGAGVAGTVAVSGLTVALGMLTRGIKDCAAAANWAARMFAARQAGGAVASAAGSAGGSAVSPAAAAGGGAVAARGSRLAGIGKGLGLAGLALAAFDAVDNVQGAFGPNKKYSANNYALGLPVFLDSLVNPLGNARASKIGNQNDPSGYWGRVRKEMVRNNMGWLTDLGPFDTGAGSYLNRQFSNVEQYLGLSRSFDRKGKRPSVLPEGTGGARHAGSFPSDVRPEWVQLEDIYKIATIAALSDDPIDRQIKQQQRMNDVKVLEELQGINENTKCMADNGPAVRP